MARRSIGQRTTRFVRAPWAVVLAAVVAVAVLSAGVPAVSAQTGDGGSQSEQDAGPDVSEGLESGTLEGGSQLGPAAGAALSVSDVVYPNLGAELSALADAAASAVRGEGGTGNSSDSSDIGDYAVSMLGLSITFDGDSEQAVQAIAAVGGDVRNVFDGYVEAFVPPAALAALAQIPGLTWAREFAVPHKDRGRYTSGGVAAHLAGAWHDADITGAGVKIGVIDGSSGATTRDGFTGLRAAMASGDLPATVVGRCYKAVALATGDIDDCAKSGRDDHGLYVAATVMDVAPDASLYISNPFTWGDLQRSVEWMRDQGVGVIVYSTAWSYHGAADGTTPVNPSPLNTVKWAADNGIVWVSSTGNYNGKTWFGAFTDADNDNIHEWATGDEYQEFTLNAGEVKKAVFMRWDDAWGTASKDLALLVVKNPGTAQEQVVDNLNDEQKGGPNSYPYEFKQFTAPDTGTYAFVVKKVSGATPGWIQMATFGSLAHSTVGHSLLSPADSPHAGLLAVGAASTASSAIRSYSSRGPTPDGRVKPDIVGADGYWALYGSNFGTSFAAPHVAGLAALVRQQNPAFTAAQTTEYLKTHAVPRGSTSPNNTWGHGFAQLTPFGCVDRLDGDGAVSGAWTASCVSAVDAQKSSRYYTLTISQQSTVTIDLSSGVDGYLYLRDGYNSQKGVALHEDDDSGTGTDARISETLAAGTYTIEATTASTGQTGAFTLAVSGGLTALSEVSIAAGGDITEGGNATFTLTANPAPQSALAAAVEITTDGDWGINPRTQTVTIPTTGTATLTLATTDDSTEEYNGSVTIRVIGKSAYVVSATAASGTVQVSDNNGGDPDSCIEHLTADGSSAGFWSSDCVSRVRDSRYARFYTFELTERSTVTIELKSSNDPYLYLRRGKGFTRGQALYENDDIPATSFTRSRPDARVRESLPAGWYTIEARTVWRSTSGSFTLDVRGLGAPTATPEVSITAGAGITEGGDATFTVTADPAPSAALDVTVAVTQSGDFGVTPTSQTVSIPTSGAATLTVATADDSADEADGSVTATVGSGQGYTVSATAGSAAVAIADDDDPPCDTVDAISRARAAFSWHVDNNGGNEALFWQVLAYLGADPLPAPPGGAVLASTTPEAVKTFSDGKTWTGWVPINAAMSCHPPPPEVSIAAGADIDEGGDATFTVTADPAPTAALDVTVAVTAAGDFGASPGSRTVTIPTTGTVTLSVSTADDSADEADGSVTATVGAGSGYTVSGTAGAAAVAVRDDDVPEVSIAAGADIDEGGSASFAVTADPVPSVPLAVVVAVSQAGDFGASPGSRTVTVPTSGSATLSVATDDDSADEADGSVTATISTGAGYTVSAVAGTAAVAVRDDDDPPVSDPVVSIAAGSGVTEGGDATFTVSAVPAPSSALSVDVSVAQSGDFGVATGSRRVTVGTSGTGTLSVSTVGDSVDEADGSVTATVVGGSGYSVSQALGSASVAVADDDVAVSSGDLCVAALSGDGSVAGVWASGCVSSVRAGRFARFYSFSLDAPSQVTVDLVSSVDTYLYLRAGQGRKSGAALVFDDDGGDGYDSRISRTLAAGGYTIEATTYHASAAGPFTLTVAGIPTQTVVQPDPEVSIAAGAGVTEGGDAIFTVTAVPAPSAGLDVAVAVTQSGDFGVSPGSRTVTVPATGSATLTVATTDDSADEADGSVTAALSAGSGYTVSATAGAASVAVADDDDAVSVCVPSLPSDAVTVSEVTGWRDGHSGAAHVLRWNRVLAALGTDTGAVPMTVEQSRANESVFMFSRWDRVTRTLEALEQCDGPPAATPEVSITAGAGVTEGGDAAFAVTADPAPSAPLTVDVTVVQAGDFGVSPGARSVTVPTSGSVTLTVATANDSTDEADGSVTVTVGAGSGYTVSAAAGTATVAVADDDDPPAPPPPAVDPEVSITAGSSITEGGDATFTVTAVPAPSAPLTVEVTVVQVGDFGVSPGARSVTVPTSGAVTLAVATTNDAADEADGSVTAAVDAGSGYTVSATAGSASVAVADDDDPPPPPPPVVDPEVSISAGSSVTEGGDAAFTVTAVPAPAAPLTVTVSVSQSGDFGVTPATRTVTVSTSGSATLTVATANDSTDEADGSVTVTLDTGAGYSVSQTAAAATVAVADDDDPAPPPPLSSKPSISVGDATAGEGDGAVEFIVRLSAASTAAVTVYYAANPGTAMPYADYLPEWGRVTFAAGDTSKTVRVSLIDDRTSGEGDETFVLKLILSDTAHATLADDRAQGTITDND